MKNFTHRCTKLDEKWYKIEQSDNIFDEKEWYFYTKEDQWDYSSDFYRVCVISYCPFCGERLENIK